MKDIEFSVNDIKDLMNTFSKNRLGSLKIEQGSFKLELEGAKIEQIVTAVAPAAVVTAASHKDEAVDETPAGNIVKAPIVGTFYAAPAPDKAPYVSAGTAVKKGDVLFIIESMKLMNEVTSEFDGVVGEILVKNGQAVEYGQPVLTIV